MERFSAEKHVAKIGVSASEKRIDGEYLTHWHEFYEIEYIISGNGDYVIDGKRYPIHPGALFLMTPLSFHCVSAKNCNVINVMFSERLCNAAYLAHFLKREQAIVLSLTDGEMRLMESLLKEIVEECADEIYLSSLMNTLCGKILKLTTDEADSSCIGRDIVYLLQHFRENPSLAETAAYAGFAPAYFSSRFKTETGENFKDYLDRLRFEYAKKLLMHTDKSVTEICAESGFKDYPNFIRRFKKRFGVSPGELKKRSTLG